jgi:hypothetical protein
MAYSSSIRPRQAVKRVPRRTQIDHTPGTFAAYTLYGREAQQEIDVQIYLPSSYDGTTYFPHMFWLPGSESSAAAVAGVLDSRLDSGIRQHVVIVPEAGPQSYYKDNVAGTWKMRTKMRDLKRLAPQIVKTYDDPAWRGIAGFSMGGYGALKIAGEEPDDYAFCLAMGPPKLVWDFPAPPAAPGSSWTDAQVADLAPVEEDTPGYLWDVNRAALKARGANFLYIMAGTQDGGRSGILNFNSLLTAWGYTYTYEETDDQHVLSQYTDSTAGWKNFITSVA